MSKQNELHRRQGHREGKRQGQDVALVAVAAAVAAAAAVSVPVVEAVDDVDLPPHVGHGEAVVIDHIGPGEVGRDLEDSRLAFAVTLQVQAVAVPHEGVEVVIESSVTTTRMLPQTQTSRSRRPSNPATGEFDPSKKTNLTVK